MTLTAYFLRLARYHVWATQVLLDKSLQHLGDEQWHRDCGLFFGSVHRTVNHLLVTDNIWHARFAQGVSPRMALDTELFHERDPLVAALRKAVQRWPAWLEGLSESDAGRLDGDLSYTRNNGETVRIPFAPALGHVFNHATHHRGQISAALTSMGLPGPELDWVYQLQQEARSNS
ncbi:DinB family protein [Variovorax dokdonensis]|uniref:DinB family protein n=1 Tax=Variovorax dokdonensis TaxID=344883 RepID=A0ABT7N4Q8_9BURK|nr:DinB family protein [Variovorax dokdonensis]MDM0042914.1 DinB family protein [Variovorax dokdonensis]